MSIAFWQRFFQSAGIPNEDAQDYAIIFEENRIAETMLGDLRKEHLLDMGIRKMGDIIGILKCASDRCLSQQKSRLLEMDHQLQQHRTAAAEATAAAAAGAAATGGEETQLRQHAVDHSHNHHQHHHHHHQHHTGGSSTSTSTAANNRVVAPLDSATDRDAAATAAAKERPVFSRLGELSSRGKAAASAVVVGASAAAAAATETAATRPKPVASVFNRLGGSADSSATTAASASTATTAPLSLTIGVSGSGGVRRVVQAAAAPPPTPPSLLSQKPRAIEPIRFDLGDRRDGEGPSPPKKQQLRVVDRWPVNTGGSSCSGGGVGSSSAKLTQQQQPLEYRGVLKLPTSGGAATAAPTTVGKRSPMRAAATAPGVSAVGVRKAEAHSTVDELGPTLYSDAYPEQQRQHQHHQHHQSRSSGGRETSAKRRLGGEPSGGGGGRVTSSSTSGGGGGAGLSSRGDGAGGDRLSSTSGRYTRIVVHRSTR